MGSVHKFSLEAWYTPTVLARVCLVLSRRRLMPTGLVLRGEPDDETCQIEFTVDCAAVGAPRLQAQLSRITELRALSVQPAVRRAGHGPVALEPDAATAA